MHASVQSLSELRSAWGARIFAWLTPHALSEILPVHVAPKQDVASKAVAKVILEIILEHSQRVRQAHGESVSFSLSPLVTLSVIEISLIRWRELSFLQL